LFRIEAMGGAPVNHARVRFLATLAAAAAVPAALIGAGPAPASHLTATAATTPGVAWGFNEDWGWARRDFHPELVSRQLRYAGQVMPDGLSANRFHVQWAAVEDRRGRYGWGRTDRVYHAMQQYSSDPVMVLYNAPWWARDPHARCRREVECAYPPRVKHLDDWRRFVRRAVERYPDVRAIEVWNEPNLARFWAPRADPGRYSQLLVASHDAVASTGNDTPVLVGGLLPVSAARRSVFAAEFLRDVYATAGAESFEGIAAHPYPHHAPFVENMWRELDALRTVRATFDDTATPLWITEIGVSTHASTGVAPDLQGDLLVELYRSIAGHDIRSFVVHRFQIGAEGGYWNGTAVVGNQLSPKPAFCELGAAIGTPCVDY
jgi:hypothetical protein